MTHTHLALTDEPSHLRLVCPSCSSDEIVYGGLLSWSAEMQQWRVLSVVEEAHCSNCGASVSAIDHSHVAVQ